MEAVHVLQSCLTFCYLEDVPGTTEGEAPQPKTAGGRGSHLQPEQRAHWTLVTFPRSNQYSRSTTIIHLEPSNDLQNANRRLIFGYTRQKKRVKGDKNN